MTDIAHIRLLMDFNVDSNLEEQSDKALHKRALKYSMMD